MNQSPSNQHIARATEPATPCLICGYDLFRLPAEGACPECGSPASQQDGALFVLAGPAFAERLKKGATLVLLASVFRLCFDVAGAFVGLLLPDGLRALAGPTILATLLPMAITVLAAIGWWSLTSPPPWVAHDANDGQRRFLRAMIVAFVVLNVALGAVGLIASVVLEVNPLNAPVGAIIAASALGILVLAVYVLGYVAAMGFLDPFCQRLGDARLHKRARRLRWTIPLAIVAIGGFHVLIALIEDSTTANVGEFLGALLGAALYYIVWVKFLLHLQHRIREIDERTNPPSPTVPETQTEPHPEPPAP